MAGSERGEEGLPLITEGAGLPPLEGGGGGEDTSTTPQGQGRGGGGTHPLLSRQVVCYTAKNFTESVQVFNCTVQQVL